MRVALVPLLLLFMFSSTGCSSWALSGHSRSGLRIWKAYTFEGQYQINQGKSSGPASRFTVERWGDVQLDDGTYCLWLELSKPDDRWSPETAGPFHNYTNPFADLFVLSDERPPFDVTLEVGEKATISVWMMSTGYIDGLSDNEGIRDRLNERAKRLAGEIAVRRGWNERLYVDFNIASGEVEGNRYTAIRGELMTYRHFGKVTWRTNMKGIRSRFNESWSESTWP